MPKGGRFRETLNDRVYLFIYLFIYFYFDISAFSGLLFKLSFRNCLSCVLTARIFLPLIFHPQFKCVFHIFMFIYSSFTGIQCIRNSQYDQLPVGLIAQLVERCTGIAEVIGSSQKFFSGLVQPARIFRLFYFSVIVHTAPKQQRKKLL